MKDLLPNACAWYKAHFHRTEANVIIYAACLPTIRPLLKLCLDTISVTTRRGITKGKSGIGERSGGTSNGSQHIKLSSVDKEKRAWQKGHERTEAWESPTDNNDSDKARILKPDRIAKSVRVEIRSQKESNGQYNAQRELGW